MFRRLVLAFIFVLAGFSAGLVITGRMHSASESSADVVTTAEPIAEPAQAPVSRPVPQAVVTAG
ncbi:MAG TPA: hypothetical protein VH701_09820, partial [Vicinamibacterales bacterium]